jgi:hypothetical protein
MQVVYNSLAPQTFGNQESRKNSTAVPTRSHFYRIDTTRLQPRSVPCLFGITDLTFCMAQLSSAHTAAS